MASFFTIRVAAKPQLNKQGITHRRYIYPRWYSSSYSLKTLSSRPNTFVVWGLSGVIVTLGGLYWSSNKSVSNNTSTVPAVEPVASEVDIPLVSPVKALDLESANIRLREQAQSFIFATGNKMRGRLDVTRVASNNPVEDEWSIGIGQGINGEKTLFAGVFDGHAGWATSKVLKDTLIPYVSLYLSGIRSRSSGEAIDMAIKTAFTSLDERIMTNARKAVEAENEPGSAEVNSVLAPAFAGSCALLTMYEPKTSTLRTAVAGDSRAVLGLWSSDTGTFTAHALSKDQTGFNEEEVKRLNAEHPGEGGDILSSETGRLMGIAVTRGFGDHRWKWTNDFINFLQSNFYGSAARPKSKTPPYMTAAPEVTTRTVQPSDFVILASDGLWDVMSNDDAVTCVSRWLEAYRNGKAEEVEDAKITGYTVDNDGYPSYKATPEYFAIEDLDNAAVCLVKNALGGRRRGLFRGLLTISTPVSRDIRDDITVQVIFFKDPLMKK